MLSICAFTIRAFGCAVTLSSSCAEGERALEQWVFPCLPREEPTAADILIHIEKVVSGFAVYADDARVAMAADEPALALALIRALDEAIIPRMPGLCAVHAGAVAWQDRVLLLPGKTHAGKSSLVAALLRRGAVYLSDEYALIDVEGRAHPYPRPLLVRNGCPEQVPVLAESTGAATQNQPLPVGWILALQFGADTTWQVCRVPQSEGLMTLLRNTPHVLAERPEMVDVFGRAVAGAH
jgi:hypothetical protein